MKHILLPTDFSDNAWNAIFYALKIYKDVPCHFYVLHSYRPHPVNILGGKGSERLGTIYNAMEETSQDGLATVENYLKTNHSHPNHTFQFLSQKGDIITAINEVRYGKNIDGIVMGTKGATGAQQIFLGSTTVKVIKAIRYCPVIAVPETYNFQRLKQLVFPTDFTRFYSEFELLPMIELALLWKTHIRIFYAAQEFLLNDSQQVNLEFLKEHFKDLECTFHNVGLKTTVAQAIDEFAGESSSDMIALIHYGHSFMEKLTQEPVVKKIGFQTKIPLMVLPELS